MKLLDKETYERNLKELMESPIGGLSKTRIQRSEAVETPIQQTNKYTGSTAKPIYVKQPIVVREQQPQPIIIRETQPQTYAIKEQSQVVQAQHRAGTAQISLKIRSIDRCIWGDIRVSIFN